MRTLKTFAVAAIVVLVASCGTKQNNQQPQGEDAQRKAFESLPASAVVRVPVENGKELRDKAEFKIVDQGKPTDSSSAETLFQSGKAPEKTISSKDELDGDSSTQSWYYPSCYTYSCYGYGYGYNSSYYYSNYYSSSYYPYVNWYGYNWNYNYYNTYNCNGYNYYYYNRSCYSYSWCGSYYY